jgi:hypothetical protein
MCNPPDFEGGTGELPVINVYLIQPSSRKNLLSLGVSANGALAFSLLIIIILLYN